MTNIEDTRALVRRDHGLAVVAVPRADGSVGATVVNAGVIPHTVAEGPVVAFVSGAQSRRLDRIRAGHPITLTFRFGPSWITVEGHAELAGPDDPHDRIPPDAVPQLLRQIFAAAGGTHDDWNAYDDAMAAERRVAVLTWPERIYSNA